MTAAALTAAEAAAYARSAVLAGWTPQMRTGTPDHVVGQGGVASLQAAINLVAAAGDPGRPVVIGVRPGLHAGLAHIPPLPQPLSIIGLGRSPADTVLQAAIDAQMPGAEFAATFGAGFADAPAAVRRHVSGVAALAVISTDNAAVLRVDCDDVQISNLTIRNSYNADRWQPGPQDRNPAGQYATGQHQAVALMIAGADRVLVQDARLDSFQDTLYLQAQDPASPARVCLSRCAISGDVDFIFGGATAWFSRCVIRSRGSRSARSWATAPCTALQRRFGFVFEDCDFTHDGDALMGPVPCYLGRQWFRGVRATPFGTPDIPGYRCDLGTQSGFDPPRGTISHETLYAVGKCAVLRCRIGAHIRPGAAWDDWNSGPWTPRYRPVLYRGADMQRHLSGWLAAQGLGAAGVDPAAIYLAEYDNIHVPPQLAR